MSFIFGNDIIVSILFGVAIFALFYLYSEKVLQKIQEKSSGSREEVLRLLDMMFVEVNRKR
ncbi:MAG: hypothetical protein KDD35_07240, partial [Bdellovibrionales bacterium]|nr:hypothetical protein [Bdellovibrionales bacterium]